MTRCGHQLRIIQQNWYGGRVYLVILKCEHCDFTHSVEIPDDQPPLRAA